MTFQALSVPAGTNQFFSAFSLSLLLPALEKGAQCLATSVRRLFGDLIPEVHIELYAEIEQFTLTTKQTIVLNSLIDRKLRSRLANYILAHQEEYVAFFESNSDFLSGVEDLRKNKKFYGHFELKALAQMVNVHLSIYKDVNDDVSIEYVPSSKDSEEYAVSLLYRGIDDYQCLLDPELLTPASQEQLFPEWTKNKAIMKSIQTLCITFCQENAHLNHHKIEIVRGIQNIQSLQEVMSYLEELSDIDGYQLSHQDYLSRRDISASWKLLILFTFPISLPLLLLMALLVDRWQFLANPGRVFVKELKALCVQAQPHEAPIVEDFGTKRVDAKQAKKLVTNDLLFVNPFSGPPPVYSTPEDISIYVHDNWKYSKLLVRVQESEAKDAAAKPRGQVRDPLAEINHKLAAGKNKFFSDVIDVEYRDYTGLPMLTSYRFNTNELPISDKFLIDIKVVFKWTNEPGMRTAIQLFNEFMPPQVEHLAPFVEPEVPPELDRIARFKQSWRLFFTPQLDFDVLFKKVKDTGYYPDKIAIAYEALQYPHTKLQRISVVELLVIAIDLGYRSSRNRCSLEQRWDKNDIALAKAKYLKKIQDVMNNLLPSDYLQVTPKAVALQASHKRIWELIYANQLGEAWAIYQSIDMKDVFIKYAFPHLQAMNHQLAAIFIISGHMCWEMSGAYIVEQHLFFHARGYLRLAAESLEIYNPQQKQAFEEMAMAPINQLFEIGKEAASKTPFSERRRIHHYRIQETGGGANGRRDGSYRNPYEDMDAIWAPRIVEIEDGNHQITSYF